MRFEAVSDREFRVVALKDNPPGPLAVLGYARRLRETPRRTKDWMKELREGES